MVEEQRVYYEQQPAYSQKFLKDFLNLMTVSFVIWIVIVAYQFLFGLPALFIGYGISMIGCGVWNLIGAIKFMKFIKIVKQYPTFQNANATYHYMNNSLTSTWIFLFVNLILGGFLGFIGCAYDLFLIYYAKGHKKELGIYE